MTKLTPSLMALAALVAAVLVRKMVSFHSYSGVWDSCLLAAAQLVQVVALLPCLVITRLRGQSASEC